MIRQIVAVSASIFLALATLVGTPAGPATAASATMPVLTTYLPYVAVTLTAEGLDPATGRITFQGRGSQCQPAAVSYTVNRASVYAWADGSPTVDGHLSVSGALIGSDPQVAIGGSSSKLTDTLSFNVCGDSRGSSSLSIRMRSLLVYAPGMVGFSTIPLQRIELPVTVSEASCLPTVTQAAAATPHWAKPDNTSAYYMPELAWSEMSVAAPTDDYASCDSPQSVRLGKVTAQGPGHGVVVLEYKQCGYVRCTMTYDGRTYNLKDKSILKKLSCSRISYIPTSRGSSDLTRPSYLPNAGPGGLRSDFSRYMCLPVPKKPGTYPVRIDEWSPPVTEHGRGWLWKCSFYGSTVTCGWQYEGNWTYSQTSKWRTKVTVEASGVTVR